MKDTATHPLLYLYEYVTGTIEEASGQIEIARAHYLKAGIALATHRSWQSTDELKITVLEDESVIYQAIIAASISTGHLTSKYDAATFEVIQRAKHWNKLREMLRSPAPAHDSNRKSPLTEKVVALRQEMNWLNRRITVEELRSERSPDSIAALREKSRAQEAILIATLEELQGGVEVDAGNIVSLDVFVNSLPKDATFLEYVEVRGILFACLINRPSMHLMPLASVIAVRSLAQSLQEQLSRLARKPGQSFDTKHSLLETLAALYSQLLAPIRDFLRDRQLIIAPTTCLQDVPFDELYDGSRHVGADFTVSYTKSATTFATSAAKP